MNFFFFLSYDIYQEEELEVDGGGGGGGITPPVDQMEMANDTKRLKISCGNCRGGSILLTQPSFSIPYMKFTNMLEMWFCRDISKNIPPYRMLSSKYVQHVKGGNQK